MLNVRRTLLNLLGLAILAPSLFIQAAEPKRSNNPEDVVARLYRDYAWETDEQPHPQRTALINEPGATLANYFDKRLVELFLRDQRCKEQTRGICNLDFDPIYASQDPGVKDLEIGKMESNGVVVVRFVFPGDGEKTHLHYKLAHTPTGWRITDIEYSDHSWLSKFLSQ